MSKSWIWPIIALPTIPYLVLSVGLWSFPGCPPESLEYPGHPAPSVPLRGSLEFIALIWAWFALWAAVSSAWHRFFAGRPSLWQRAIALLMPLLLAAFTVMAMLYLVIGSVMC